MIVIPTAALKVEALGECIAEPRVEEWGRVVSRPESHTAAGVTPGPSEPTP